jgi:hypothetical protein
MELRIRASLEAIPPGHVYGFLPMILINQSETTTAKNTVANKPRIRAVMEVSSPDVSHSTRLVCFAS